MENTGKVLLEDDGKPQWYLALGDRWIGPMTASDILEKITAGEITWVHYVWKKNQSDWKRICDIKTFQIAQPSAPSAALQKELKASVSEVRKSTRSAPPPSPSSDREWFLYYNDSQYGPFSAEEVTRYLGVGKIHGRVHAWKEGMANWERLEAIEFFKEAVEASKKARSALKSGAARQDTENRERRTAPRQPLVAKMLLANDQTVITAVCRDISIGGMQVLTDRMPGDPGTKIRLNVSPSGQLAAQSGSKEVSQRQAITPFVAEGVIVRFLEDGRGFSFRFERLSSEAKQSIEGYLASTSEWDR